MKKQVKVLTKQGKTLLYNNVLEIDKGSDLTLTLESGEVVVRSFKDIDKLIVSDLNESKQNING